MDLSRNFILIKGEPKTQQIAIIKRNEANGYCVRFKNGGKVYSYSRNNVIWLIDPEWVDPTHAKVYIGGLQKHNVREIWKFTRAMECYWRIIYANGYIQEGDESNIKVGVSCLGEEISRNRLAYLKNVAIINPLGKDKDSDGLLAEMYAKLKFIDIKNAAACYLNPEQHIPADYTHNELIFPFGCNASQKTAVATAFEHQLSVIQGPPGTGKTQTILNIIANIVSQGKTALVVSNNNSAIANILEKLEKYGTSFIVAFLGNNENKDAFIANQPKVPVECAEWGLHASEILCEKQKLHSTQQQFDKVYALQNERAELLQELQAVKLEWKHFCMYNDLDENAELRTRVSSKRIISLWLKSQAHANGEWLRPTNRIAKFKEWIMWCWTKLVCRYRLHVVSPFDRNNLTPLIKELQMLYYQNRIEEIQHRIEAIEKKLTLYDAKSLADTLTEVSMSLFRSCLHDHYAKHERMAFASVGEMKNKAENFTQQYPVVLSTTFSARSCVFADNPYDYIIMDEASQVSIETGLLALTCANNAVIVGDTLQLPNVVIDEDKLKLDAVKKQYDIPDGYDCAKYSFLQSILNVINNVPETLLREHYRCHPRIINFCNQKFYGGNLLIMTEDKGEENVLTAVKTVKGNHASNHYNQREIDVVKEEVLPALKEYDDVGIVTPYNNQASAFNSQLGTFIAGTIHKYQGRENDAIIMSVVDNQITEFADDANLLNVAVSRAKKKFCLVMTGNEQERHGNIMDLLDYIAYNNCEVTESKLASIFDYLYEQYTEQRMAFFKNSTRISEYTSENLTFTMLNDVIASEQRYSVLKVLCHVPLRQVVKDTSLLNEEECRYTANYNTHLDFLIVNRVSKQPILAVETDGYSYHNSETKQYQRDMKKNHILTLCGLTLLRLSTKGSDERQKVVSVLNELVSDNFL